MIQLMKVLQLTTNQMRCYQKDMVKPDYDQYVDLRSDTVTRPSQKMKQAMFEAVVGDDVYGDDPTINALQEQVANLFGKEQSLFVPSGAMSNLISMMTNVKTKGDAAIIGSLSHIMHYERGGISSIGSILPIVLPNNPDGTIDTNLISYSIPPKNEHLPQPKVIALESPHNNCNGKVLRMDYIKQVKQIADKNNLKMHLDSARGLNAATFLNIDPKEMAKDFDTLTLCFSKGLGCPFGSMVIGSEEDIQFARIIRKLLGGSMRQGGIMAASCLVALEDWKEVLQQDHQNARFMAEEISNISAIDIDLSLIETNIIRFKFKEDFKKFSHIEFSQLLKNKYKILINPSFQLDAIRVVTHKDANQEKLKYVIQAFKESL